MKLRAFFRIMTSRKIWSLLLKLAFITATVIAIMTDSESDIKPLSKPLSAPDSEPDSEVENALLASFKPRDSVPFSLSQLSASVPPPPSISEPSQPSVSTPHEPSEPPSQRNIDPVTKGVALALFHTLPGTKEERYKEIEKSTGVK